MRVGGAVGWVGCYWALRCRPAGPRAQLCGSASQPASQPGSRTCSGLRGLRLRRCVQDEMGEHAVTAVVATWPGEDGQPEVHFEVGGRVWVWVYVWV